MEKKDLVIGKEYLHKSNSEVYYLGEGERGYSVIQPINGVDGVTSLKDSHPKIKDIIGNDRFWAYENIHLELKEIEPKSLSLQDLIIGEIYVSEIPNNPEWRSLFKCVNNIDEDYTFEYRLYTSDDYQDLRLESGEYGFTKRNNYYKASKEEKDWLNVCIKANKFIPKEDLDLYDDVTFELKNLKEDVKNNKNEFEIGTWYYCKSGFEWYFKYVKEDSNKVEFYDYIDIDLKEFGKNNYLCCLTKKEIKNIRKVELSEIQEYLPEGHIDKEVIPEYVECIKEDSGIKIGEIYRIKKEKGYTYCDMVVYYLDINESPYFQSYFKPSTKEAYDAQNNQKSIKKWSVGSYVVCIKSYGIYFKIGDIAQLEEGIYSIEEDCVNLSKWAKHSCMPFKNNCEWFATLEEAQKFSKTLLNKNDMFKKDDYIIITILNQNNDGFITNFCYKQRDNKFYLRPELTTLGNICNGWGLITYSSSHWRYATKKEIAEYDRLGKPFNVTTLNEKEELLDEVKRRYPIGSKFKCLHGCTGGPISNYNEIDCDDDGVVRWEGRNGCGCLYDENIDIKWAEIIYEDLVYAYTSFQPYFEFMVPSDECNSKLDLSLRDEKEINVKEIKSNNNNNNSKLNLSLNN